MQYPQTIPYNFTPRDYQLPLLDAMDSGCKRAVCVWHRRAGKDKTLVNLLMKKMTERVGTYYYFFPTYKQGKKILWNGMDKTGFKFTDHIPLALRKRTDNGEMLIELKNGSVFQVIGTDNMDSIVGTNPVGCVFSEYALQNPRAWDLMRPVLRENGGWAIFNFTPRGKNHGYDLYKMACDNPDWFCQLLTVKDTHREDGAPIITEADLEAEKREGMDADLILQEYFCSFSAAIRGAYYGDQITEAENPERPRIGVIPYDPALFVHTAWDIGHGDATSIIFFQMVGKEIRMIDFIEDWGKGVEHYVTELLSRKYRYGTHWVPHDFFSKQFSSGKSSLQAAQEVAQAQGKKMEFKLAPRLMNTERGEVQEGIQAVRRNFPRFWIDEVKCKKLLDAIREYKKKWDDNRKTFLDYPEHDWTSHAADALRYLAVSLPKDPAPPAPAPRPRAPTGGWRSMTGMA